MALLRAVLDENEAFQAKCSKKFYVLFAIFAVVTLLLTFALIRTGKMEILLEDGTPMGAGAKLLLTTLLFAVIFTWLVSLLTLIKLGGTAFIIDKDGIHATVSGGILFAFILFVPVRRIPFDAILSLSEENGILSAKLDKSKLETPAIFRPFLRSEYHFLSGFTTAKVGQIREAIARFTGKDA